MENQIEDIYFEDSDPFDAAYEAYDRDQIENASSYSQMNYKQTTEQN